MSVSILREVFHPKVASRADLWRYVRATTILAWTVVWAVDIPHQILFAASWADCWRNWLVDVIIVPIVSVPVARSIGKAHLQLHDAKQEAERLGRVDPLTGLANRRAFYEAAAELAGGGAVALAIADLDRFKRINDRFGHAAGDEALKAAADLMRAELGDLGLVARVGGEEFALIAAGRSADEIAARLQRFRQRVADEPLTAAGGSVHLTVSIGFAVRRDCNFDALYAAADRALYVAKSAGRDRVVDGDRIEGIAPLAQALAPIRQAG
jgi:diguanylate cyclase (GGDEF)-like protein